MVVVVVVIAFVVVVVVVAGVVVVVVVAGVVVVVVVAGVVVVVAGVVVVVAFVVVVVVVAGMGVVVVVIVVSTGIFEQRLNAFQAMVPQQIWTVPNGDSHGSFLLAVQGASPKQSATHLRFTFFVDTTSDKKERNDSGT